MQIGAKFPFSCSSLHGTYYMTVNHKSTDITAFRFFDKFLNNDPCFQTVESFQNRFSGFSCLRQNNTEAEQDTVNKIHHRTGVKRAQRPEAEPKLIISRNRWPGNARLSSVMAQCGVAAALRR